MKRQKGLRVPWLPEQRWVIDLNPLEDDGFDEALGLEPQGLALVMLFSGLFITRTTQFALLKESFSHTCPLNGF